MTHIKLLRESERHTAAVSFDEAQRVGEDARWLEATEHNDVASEA